MTSAGIASVAAENRHDVRCEVDGSTVLHSGNVNRDRGCPVAQVDDDLGVAIRNRSHISGGIDSDNIRMLTTERSVARHVTIVCFNQNLLTSHSVTQHDCGGRHSQRFRRLSTLNTRAGGRQTENGQP